MMLKRRICILLALALAFGCAGFTPVHAADYDVAAPESVTTQITDSEISLSPEIAQENELAQLCEIAASSSISIRRLSSPKSILRV